MLAAGLFVGTTVFLAVAGTSFNAAVVECGRLPLGRPPGPNVFSICLAPVERPRALYAASAAAVVALGATVMLFVAPALIERRRRLRPAGPALAPAVQRMQALANGTGLRRPPTLVVGPPALRDAFCYGRPGRYGTVASSVRATQTDPLATQKSTNGPSICLVCHGSQGRLRSLPRCFGAW